MREIPAELVATEVARLCQEANYTLGAEMLSALQAAKQQEQSPLGQEILGLLLENAQVAADRRLPLCQDTGLAVVFVEIGQEVQIIGGGLTEAINRGVRQGYREGYLRCSVVSPLEPRVNTGDNTPAVIWYDLVPGSRLRIVVMPKGGGSENMGAAVMLEPSAGQAGVCRFVLETVDRAGANPCPPLVVGVGIGGNLEKAAYLAKHALLRPLGNAHPDPAIARLERELLAEINCLGIGPQGLGGRVTALAVHIETVPTHIASLPVAVNLSCHCFRHREVEL